MNIKDCKAIVTGGASGLGEACVRNFIEAGAQVAILDRDSARGEKLAAELGGNAVFAEADITSEESVQRAIKRALDSFGSINTVINCAGIGDIGKMFSKKGPLPLATFNRVVQVNLIGTFNVLRLAVAEMVNNDQNENGEKGVIINTASIAGFDGQIGQPAYAASKAAVIGLTLPLARECADYGIRVMTIAPGIFKTPMMAAVPQAAVDAIRKTIPFPSRFGNPDEYAVLAMHIVENPYLNGEVIRLDGAVRMAPR
jgi:NAD(P)-dependent dehydrogenase (short-subunit alcohol dehydrogenase family)